MRRALTLTAAAAAITVAMATPALACGGLIGPNGAVNLTRTTTFAGYHAGVEHYVTSFSFAGGGGAFGSLTPLPGVPTKVERGGAWTLQRLERETAFAEDAAGGAALSLAPRATKAEVLLQTKIDALDITVLRGGGEAVGTWAREHGFRLPPDAPEVLDFYARRSPIFLAAAFDANAARKRGQQIGDGTPVHVTIPTANPWVPLRILALGKSNGESVDADVYLLTDHRPRLLSTTAIGKGFGPDHTLSVVHDAKANDSLLTDLRTDASGGWVPSTGWLTKVRIAGPAATLTGDLAIDPTGEHRPSMVAAGYAMPALPPAKPHSSRTGVVALGILAAWLLVAAAVAATRRTSS